VGSAVKLGARWKLHRHHLKHGSHHSRHLQSSWDKHGPECFEFRVLEVVEVKANLIDREQHYFDTLRPEYNIAPVAGSCLGVRATPEQRQRASERAKQRMLDNPDYLEKLREQQARISSDPEVRAKRSAALKGRISPMKGKTRPASAVEKTASAHRGMKRSDATKAKLSAIATGRKMPPRSAETKAKLSASSKGRILSPEHMAALQAGRRAHKDTPEQRAAKSEALRRGYENGTRSRERPPEYRAKIAATLRGRSATPEHRANQSAAQRGKKRGPYKRATASE
jgi:group I intron endonuclease